MTDKEVRVQDDLFEAVNGEWLKNAVIPDDKPTTGGFSDLDKDVEELLINDFKKMINGEIECPNKNVKKACEIFKLTADSKKRNKDGVKPILKTLKRIEKLTNVRAFNKNLVDFVIDGLPLPFKIDVDANMMDTTKHCVMLTGPSCILPDTTYYKEEMKPQHDALFGIWTNMAKELLTYSKLTEEDQAKYIEDTIKFDEIIATLVKSSEEWSEYTKMFNPMKTSRVASLMKPIKLKNLLEGLFKTLPEEVVVAEPRYFKAFKTVFNEDNFELYKHWAYVQEFLGDAGLLSVKVRDLATSYQRALSGIAAAPTVEKQGYRLASYFYSEPIGLYYGNKYFGEEAKKDVVSMVKEIIETYKTRVANNDFLSPSTKDKAILKLNKMVIKMGYPDKADAVFDKLVFDAEDNLFEAVAKISRIKKLDSFEKLYQPVNREKWVMPGHMVNACYNPFTNDITFPAAILQAPFYSIKQTRSQNLGGIGAVIAHEISHAFDNNGAKCDENGNLNNWWTKEDEKQFKAKTKAMIKEFDGIELPYGTVNGAFVVSENIADNGGMAVTLEIMGKMAEKDYKEYFFNWARVWCMKAKPEYQKLLLAIDVHSPAMLRANMQPRNFPEWYETFGVKKTDKMYIAPNKRVVIW